MPVVNVIDNRSKKYRWKKVNVMAEPTYMDNRRSKRGGIDEGEKPKTLWHQADLNGVSIQEALAWANKYDSETTLTISDAE